MILMAKSKFTEIFWLKTTPKYSPLDFLYPTLTRTSKECPKPKELWFFKAS
jgi:hypothetical protein